MDEPTISIRAAWPFWRLLPDLGEELEVLRPARVDVQDLVNPAIRLSRHMVGSLLETSIRKTADPLLGLRAGLSVEPGELGPWFLAARACKDLRTALLCITKYQRLLDEALNTRLVEEGDAAVWRFGHVSAHQHPASVDFAVAASLTHMRHCLGESCEPIEIRLPERHGVDEDAYRKLLGTPVVFGSETAIVLRQQALVHPLKHRNHHLHLAFSVQADRLLNDLTQSQSLSRRVSHEVRTRLGNAPVDVHSMAQALGITASTLRRRLGQEQLSLSAVVDAVRHEQALMLLRRRELSVTEVATRLGYGSLPAFSKAFRRWTGLCPQVHRQMPPKTDINSFSDTGRSTNQLHGIQNAMTTRRRAATSE